MIGLGYNVYATAAVERLCLSTLHCIETDLYPLRCDSIIGLLRGLRPIGIIYFYLGILILLALLLIEADVSAFVWTLVRYRAVQLPNPCTRWAVLVLGYFRFFIRAYLVPTLAVVAAVFEIFDVGILQASTIIPVILNIVFILEVWAPNLPLQSPDPAPACHRAPPLARLPRLGFT
eukprot:scaffold4434_cov109-Isochrysis_galbana.AAC.8